MKKKLSELGYGANELTTLSSAFVTTEASGLVNSGMSRDLREAAEILAAAQVGHKAWTTVCSAGARAAIDRLGSDSGLPR